ncbi:MAG TPA: VOC family protein [Steroidobacteraceae bacterium]|nr:VOC family protein [Steroidobacteraceae bacterium]
MLFVLGFGPVVRESVQSRSLFEETLGIGFKEEEGGYLHTEALEGVKTFALWPLSEAAKSCFGKAQWPDHVPVPQAWLEFDVEDVAEATTHLESKGYRILVKNKREPWGQTVSRFLSPEGLLVAVSFTPSMRK